MEQNEIIEKGQALWGEELEVIRDDLTTESVIHGPAVLALPGSLSEPERQKIQVPLRPTAPESAF